MNAARIGDLGLAVPDVAADEAVHGDGPLHVGFHVLDGLRLVGRLLVREGLFDLALPGRVRSEGVAGRGEPAAVENDELLGDLAHRRPDAGAGLLPVGAAHAVQRGRLAAGVAADGADLVGRDVELVTGSVLEQQVVALDAADRARGHLLVAPDAVLVMHDEVAGLERRRRSRRRAGRRAARGAHDAGP